jgi:4-hydroxy-2-oxoheptanedioate aldolase
VANINEILEVIPSEASLFIGPYDLSQSMGKPGQIWDPEVVAKMESIVALCAAKGVSLGTFTDSPEGIKFWKERGLSFIQYASDLNLFIEASKNLLKN